MSTTRLPLGIALLVAVSCGACSHEPQAVEPGSDASDTSNPRDIWDMSFHDILADADSEREAEVGAPGGNGPYPRWILRDREGSAVQDVWITPSVASLPEYPQEKTLPNPAPEYDCFQVNWRGNQSWGGTYSLQSGRISTECVSDFVPQFFEDPQCMGSPLSLGGAIATYQDEVVYGRNKVSESSLVYLLSGETCMEVDRSMAPWDTPLYKGLYRLAPIPTEFATAFEAGAPYTVVVAY